MENSNILFSHTKDNVRNEDFLANKIFVGGDMYKEKIKHVL